MLEQPGHGWAQKAAVGLQQCFVRRVDHLQAHTAFIAVVPGFGNRVEQQIEEIELFGFQRLQAGPREHDEVVDPHQRAASVALDALRQFARGHRLDAVQFQQRERRRVPFARSVRQKSQRFTQLFGDIGVIVAHVHS